MLPFFVRRLRGHERGFTLIELLIVIAIIAILAAVLIPNFLRARAQAMVAASKSNMKNIAIALESYAADHEGLYPPEGQLVNELQNNNYMKTVPTIPGTQTSYTYNVKTDQSTYALCDNFTLSRVNSTNLLVYTPDQGLTEANIQQCPTP